MVATPVVPNITQVLQFSTEHTAAWIVALYSISGLLSLVLTLTYRQSLLIAWNTGTVVFASMIGQTRYADLLPPSDEHRQFPFAAHD